MPAMTPSPPWSALPLAARQSLTAAAFEQAWYERQDDALRWTLLVVFAKLRAVGLWRFVAGDAACGHHPPASSRGTLNVVCTDVDGLIADLRGRSNFTTPRPERPYWQSRELRMHAALHLKHFAGWPADHVQAHVDRTGLWLAWPWWLTLLVPAVQVARHLAHYHSYLDVDGRRRQLVQQGVGLDLLV